MYIVIAAPMTKQTENALKLKFTRQRKSSKKKKKAATGKMISQFNASVRDVSVLNQYWRSSASNVLFVFSVEQIIKFIRFYNK